MISIKNSLITICMGGLFFVEQSASCDETFGEAPKIYNSFSEFANDHYTANSALNEQLCSWKESFYKKATSPGFSESAREKTIDLGCGNQVRVSTKLDGQGIIRSTVHAYSTSNIIFPVVFLEIGKYITNCTVQKPALESPDQAYKWVASLAQENENTEAISALNANLQKCTSAAKTKANTAKIKKPSKKDGKGGNPAEAFKVGNSKPGTTKTKAVQ